MSRELLFSVTAKDCDWSYTRGTGAGGQKKNKTSSAVHCTHRESGAHAYSEASRSQAENRADAFRKMANTKKFQDWQRLNAMKKLGQLADVEEYVERESRKIKIEAKRDGKWVEVQESELED